MKKKNLHNYEKTVSSEPGLLISFSPYALWSPHFETELEIIQLHLDDGGRALILSCNGDLKICDPNPEHDLLICAMCKSRFRSGMRWLHGGDVSNQSFYSLTCEQEATLEALGERTWRDMNELRSFEVDGADVGMAAISSAVSYIREPELDSVVFKKLFSKNIITAALVYYSIKNILAEKMPDSLLLFSGRFSSLRPALRAAQKLGIKSYVHERAGSVDRFSLTENTYPHDLDAIKLEIETIYNNSQLSEYEKKRLSDEWYIERRKGVVQSWHSFTTDQIQNLLPSAFKSNVTNVVIFNSSEDEFVAIDGWDNPFYINQNKAIEQLMEDVSAEKQICIFLRVHPNLKGLRNSQTEGIKLLSDRYSSLHVIPADSPVDSYALIDAADVIVTYGSTVGIEAAHASKLSILMGRAPYEDLGVCLRPNAHQEFVSLLLNIARGAKYQLPTGSEMGLIKYGLFNKLWGRQFHYVKPTGLFTVKMYKNNVYSTILSNRLTRLVYKLIRQIKK